MIDIDKILKFKDVLYQYIESWYCDTVGSNDTETRELADEDEQRLNELFDNYIKLIQFRDAIVEVINEDEELAIDAWNKELSETVPKYIRSLKKAVLTHDN